MRQQQFDELYRVIHRGTAKGRLPVTKAGLNIDVFIDIRHVFAGFIAEGIRMYFAPEKISLATGVVNLIA